MARDAAPNHIKPTREPERPASGKPAAGDATPSAAAPDYSQWSILVDRIRRGEDRGMTELYSLFSKGVRFQLCRQLGPQELDDKVHDTFLIVVQAIRRGELREPERLMGFVRTVVKRQVAAHIDSAVHRRKEQADLDTGIPVADERASPEERAIARQKIEIMRDILQNISRRDREILTRFYLREQSQEQICDEMQLTETQFRLLKSRAKARFGELGKKRLNKRPLTRFFMRGSTDDRH
ncbi:MAG: sigma-70 family RNA polymerase sigma factor [Bryobacteraceae bacterium]|nr:sigma-70 family RNA polymerase sigma factor [Bryobacteraceae bacterium]